VGHKSRVNGHGRIAFSDPIGLGRPTCFTTRDAGRVLITLPPICSGSPVGGRLENIRHPPPCQSRHRSPSHPLQLFGPRPDAVPNPAAPTALLVPCRFPPALSCASPSLTPIGCSRTGRAPAAVRTQSRRVGPPIRRRSRCTQPSDYGVPAAVSATCSAHRASIDVCHSLTPPSKPALRDRPAPSPVGFPHF
jgi:hypothetical protein